MIEKIKPSILPGFMELLPEEQRIFNDIASKISSVYEANGLAPMDTPVIEKEEVLLAKSAGETEKQMYSFTKGDRRLALRFDLTVPLARYVAQYFNDLNFPFKRYQIGKSYRGERNQKGRYREFYQCDADIIGNGKLDIKNDAFVISLASQALKSIGIENYKFQISNRKILSGIFKELLLDNSVDIMRLIDKYDKIDKADFSRELIELAGEEKADFISSVIAINEKGSAVIARLQELNVSNSVFQEGIKELETVIKYLEIFGVDEREYVIDFKIIRGLDYYTGTVFETILCGNESFGSICSGGRYDNLAQVYSDNVLPGVGMSIGLTRLFFVLQEIGFIKNYNSSEKLDYLIIPMGDTVEYCFKVGKILRDKGFKIDIYLEEEKLKKKLNYANKLGVNNVIIIGEDEVSKNQVVIKDMSSGQQIIKSLQEI
ncbi:histidine--tRNA ligase [Clostridium sp. 19966]|uniref:histidine--tRNA ligase n=1 Tax=Clostridium sp. 19966 TaxID=2768166 RepID=UPI0028DDC38C|nr:histidine--tRNA ligase [Clostridium sp. 19966]MDT8718946.1 histidine--tRNA ligase [Clostridium sp. 19966]